MQYAANSINFTGLCKSRTFARLSASPLKLKLYVGSCCPDHFT